jgi:death-on-curing protein
MILLEDVLKLHELSIRDFGGSNGVRDSGLLESAIARPFQTFGGEDLYQTVIEKAAALGESLIINHPFIDGNKRTGALAILSLLAEYKYKSSANQDDFYKFIISISTGEIKFDEIVSWLKANTVLVV